MITLVVGASGATGRLLVQQLLNEGLQVRIILRSLKDFPEALMQNSRLTITQASLLDMSREQLLDHVQGCHGVVSCLGHNITVKGIFFPPRRLVTDGGRRLCDAIEKTATLLESMGHEVERAKPNYHPEDALIHCPNLWFLGFDKYIDALASATNRPINLDTLEPCTLDLYQKAKDIDPFTIFDSFDWVNRVRREFGKHFAQYDIWLTPTTVMPSEPLGRYNQSLTGLSTEEYFYLSETPVQYCAAYNITGLPAISLPLHQTSDGLPIGVQLGARHGEEELLINVSSALEQALPWANNTPEFHASKY